MSTLKEIRERFYEKKCHYEDGNSFEVYENNPEDIADFYDSEIRTLLEEIEGEVLKQKEVYEKNSTCLDENCSVCVYNEGLVDGENAGLSKAWAIITRYKE